jgi:hypothetical protein
VLPTPEAIVTADEYQRICDRIARKAVRYAKEMADPNPDPANVTNEREHWIDVYLDERMPDIDADAILDVTTHADAFEKAAGHRAPSRSVAAIHALQVDVWAAINRMTESP